MFSMASAAANLQGNCSFPFIRGGHLCLLPLMTGLIGLGHLSDKPRFYRQYAPLLVYHVAEWHKSDPGVKICLRKQWFCEAINDVVF